MIPPKKSPRFRHLVSYLFCCAILLAACSPSTHPAPLPDFTESLARQTLAFAEIFCSKHPSRDAGTPGAENAAKNIAAMLTPNTSVRIDTFTDNTPRGPLKFHNVLAEIPAQNPNAPWIVLLSHYDTKSGIAHFVGANDGASSTALLITLHGHLAARKNLPFNFLFAFLDGEECQVNYGPNDGLHGSRHLAQQLKAEGRDIRAVLLLDMIGDADLHVQLPVNSTPDLRARALAAASTVGAREHFSLSRGAVLDDHVPFLEAGFPAIDFIDFNYGPNNSYWHTAADTPDKLSADSFLIVARTLLQLIADL